MSRTKLDLSQISGTMPDETLGQYIEKLGELSYKVIVFVIPGIIKADTQSAEIRFPFSGTVDSVYCSLGTPGTTDTTLRIEKCSQGFIDDVIGAPSWFDILSDVLTVESDKKSSNSSVPVVKVVTGGLGAKDLTVELKIKIVN
ncbi:hypothetical protein D3C71_1646850 [compost metagenome]